MLSLLCGISLNLKASEIVENNEGKTQSSIENPEKIVNQEKKEESVNNLEKTENIVEKQQDDKTTTQESSDKTVDNAKIETTQPSNNENSEKSIIPVVKAHDIISISKVMPILNPENVYVPGTAQTEEKNIQIFLFPKKEIVDALSNTNLLNGLILKGDNSNPVLAYVQTALQNITIDPESLEIIKNIMNIRDFNFESWSNPESAKNPPVENKELSEIANDHNKFKDKAFFIPLIIKIDNEKGSAEIRFSDTLKKEIREIANISLKIESANKKLLKYKNEEEKIRAPHKETLEKIENAKKQLPELQEKVKEIENNPSIQEIKKLSSEIDPNKNMMDIISSLDSKSEDLKKLSEEITSKQNTLKDNGSKLSGISSSISSKTSQKSSLEFQKNRARGSKKIQLTNQISSIDSEINSLRNQSNDLNKSIESLKTDLKTLNEKETSLKSEVEKITKLKEAYNINQDAFKTLEDSQKQIAEFNDIIEKSNLNPDILLMNKQLEDLNNKKETVMKQVRDMIEGNQSETPENNG